MTDSRISAPIDHLGVLAHLRSQYFVRLIGQVITVSLEAVKLVSSLANLPILDNQPVRNLS